MADEIVLTEKERALISVSASIAAGCQPCTEYHLKGARRAGACDRSVALAVQTAFSVRESATTNMEGWVTRCAGPRPETDQEFRSQKRLVMELAALAAAAAVNSVPDILARLESAKAAGATPEQIQAAVALATSIRATAVQKAEAALQGPAQPAASCCGSPKPNAPQTGVGTGCGCS